MIWCSLCNTENRIFSTKTGSIEQKVKFVVWTSMPIDIIPVHTK